MEKDLISIIVPVYNAEKYLDRCIESIVNQTYKNIEIILVNDGSKDKSLEICTLWQKKDKRIVVVNKQNEGAAKARNDGLDIAKGEYIGFIDADDYIKETMYEKLFLNLKENNSDMSCCDYIYTYEDSDKQIECVENSLAKVTGNNICEYFIKDGETLIEKRIFKKSITGFIWRSLYKRDLIGAQRFENHRYYEDLIFLIKTIKPNTKISYVSEGLYFYFQNSSSVVHSKISVENFSKKIETCKCVISLFEEKLGVTNDNIKAYKFYVFKGLMIEAINSNLFKDNLFKKAILNDSFVSSLNSKENYKLYNKNKNFKRKISNFLIHNRLFKIYNLISM